MKTLAKTTVTALAMIAMISCKESNQAAKTSTVETEKISTNATDETFESEAMRQVWDNYVTLKTAFVKSDVTAAQSAATNIASNLPAEQADLKNIALQIADSDDLEKQRTLFSEFTDQAGPLFKDALTSGTMYKQFCPMAFNNTGAYWYSDAAEIRNPYFGDRMLKCGSVKETIKK